jgi:hypothetical protein
MSSREPRAALGSRKPSRPHPAVPSAPARLVDASGVHEEGGQVMFCVRVAPSLRRRVKLAAVGSGRTIQELTVAALEEACARVEG